ncbi:MAG: AAA family ATPase, partial [Verrucomicrobiota bacterium]|nr:AAA family ATPase [Verrucomicrobiota bacterium]
MIKRKLEEEIKSKFFGGKIILIMGPRQVGKRTLTKIITEKYTEDLLWFNGDASDVRGLFSDTTAVQLERIIGKKKIIVIDEAQRIKNIGLTLKIMIDNFPEKQIIVTGSSSLELANKIKEPLTGRKFEYHLYPLSFEEMLNHTDYLSEHRLLEQRMIYGYYP